MKTTPVNSAFGQCLQSPPQQSSPALRQQVLPDATLQNALYSFARQPVNHMALPFKQNLPQQSNVQSAYALLEAQTRAAIMTQNM
jgi:hypothetical protein